MTKPRIAAPLRYARQCLRDELPWLRPTDFSAMELRRPVVLVNGAFDLLHSGHMKVIFAARAAGKTVVVALDSDQKVNQSKGPGRPLMTFPERASALGYLPVDYLVEVDSQADMDDLVDSLRPDLRVQGSEYEGVTSRYPSIPKLAVLDRGMHTTKIIERIKDRL